VTCPENGQKIIAELNRRGLKGSVMDLQFVYDYLVKHNALQLHPQAPRPVQFFNQADLEGLSSAEIKTLIEQQQADGIF